LITLDLGLFSKVFFWIGLREVDEACLYKGELSTEDFLVIVFFPILMVGSLGEVSFNGDLGLRNYIYSGITNSDL
jgi:hypothetical protein